jgi:hypothetical protein
MERNFRLWQILLKKSFGGDERIFLEPLMRFVRSDVRGHVASQKNERSYRRYGASQRRSCPKISICEIWRRSIFDFFDSIGT